jgi:hypothetical protein
VFDEFAPKLATDHHVYGITRRGFGARVSRFRSTQLIAFAMMSWPLLAR